MMRRWPLTTACGLSSALALALVIAGGGDRQAASDLPATSAEAPAEAPAEAEPKAEEIVAAEAPAEAPAEEAAEEAVAGDEELEARVDVAPTSKSKTGLYAMKGPKDAVPALASPYGGAFAVGSDDADVWGGLTGTEVGESFGVGGLGLVGVGRGGGGHGSGYGRGIGRGGGGFGGGELRDPVYDATIQARTLTAGAVDDNADPAGYRKALDRIASERAALGIDEAIWELGPRSDRHVDQPAAIDIALVIDTTGSMGDELSYLKVELREIAREVSRAHPGVDQRWGLVVYRDRGDDYVTRAVDFQGIDGFIDALGRQQAGGGGDMPEAMDAAMVASSKLAWRKGQDTARMVFLVADAPSHAGKAARRFADAVLEHRAAGTAIYPVAGSGVDNGAEAELRLAAKVTGGHYLFLTNHSGVGGDHAAPHVEQYKVETLHDALARMIRRELGAAEAEVVADVIEVAPEVAECGAEPAPPSPIPASSPITVAAAAPASPGLWAEVQERLATHLLFASSMGFLMLAAIGADALLRRRRRV